MLHTSDYSREWPQTHCCISTSPMELVGPEAVRRYYLCCILGAHDLGLGLWMPDLFSRHTPAWDPPPYRQKCSGSNPYKGPVSINNFCAR